MATAEDTCVTVVLKVEKLTGDNYYSWKFQMKMFLITKDLWEIVTGAESLKGSATAEEQRKLKTRENLALATICLSVSTNLQIYVRNAAKAKAWDNLSKHSEQKTISRKIFHRRKLYSARMENETNMIEHINYVKTLSEHLETVEDPVNEKDLVIFLISSLPEDYNYLITALETIAEDKLTWDYVRDGLIYEADKIKNGNAGTVVKAKDTNQNALFTTNEKPDTSEILKTNPIQN